MSHFTMKGRTVLLFSLIAAYLCGTVAQTTDCKNVTMADIVFLVDGSSSIPPHGFEDIKRFLRTFIESVDIGRNKVRVGLAQYSDEPFQEFQLKDHMDKRSLLAALEGLSQRQGGTETGKAITFLHNEYFTKEAGSRASEQVPQIAVVITDGKSSDDVTKPAQSLREKKGVIVFGIGVGQADEEELKSVASRPPHRFLLTIDSFGALQHATEDLLKTVCVSMVDKRQDLVDRISDIFFLVDSGISQQQFNLFRTELNKLINQLNIGASNNRIGLAQYGQNIRVEFLLNAHQTKQETQASVKRFRLRPPQPNEPRNLGGALKYARTNFFTSDAGGRAEQGFRQFLVVVSGQASSDSVSTEVHSIRKSGVTIVGMSAGAPMDSVRLLSDQDVFDSPRVTLLKDLFITEKEDNITEECKVVNKVDIVFIVDESDSIGQANFGLVRYFLHSIVSSLDVSQTTVRVGIVTYNDNPTAQAYLDTFNDKNDTRQFIKILPYTGGGTNTGKALDFTRNEIFNEKKGSRKDVQKVAVVITDGESQDDVSEAAVRLRRKGITVFAIGIKDASISQLEQIASYPPNKHVFTVDSFTELKPMKTILQKILCNNINEQAVIDNKRTSDAKDACVPKDEADFFFLIDVSGSIDSTGLTEMKRFIIEFLHTFRVGPRHVRIGLMKYSDSPILEFDLTAYANAKDVEKAVMAIEKVGLNTYTGKALSEMEPYFKRAKSSRPKVPKYLIVITDGKATDQVMEPAKTLRDHDVNIYAIGVKGAVKAELVEIAGDNKRTFSVNDFDSLKNLHKQLITDICIPDVCKNVSGDVIFLVDGSESISEEDFQKIKDFVKSIISKTTISEDGVHVGIMQYSTEYKLEFSLNEHYNIDEMFRDIDIMQQISQGTSTGKAISAVSEYFNRNNGGRPELQQKLVVLTDGKSKDDVSVPAAALREKGVTIYAIGVADANAVELEIISGSKQRVYFDKDFDALKSWESQVVVELCKADCKKTRNADVIFLVDGSANKNLNMFKSIHRFMETIVDLTEVGKDWARFGVILYADNAESVFTLDKYNNKRDVIEAIHAIKPLRGNTNTAKAMEYSLQYFTDAHGGRPTKNIHQILMVITDRDASDHYHLERASKALKENRVIVFSIGVEPANRDQLKIMADGDESRVFYANNYDALEILRKTVSPVWCTFTQEVCETDKADLVFLLDSSSSITLDDHAIMLNFTSELVSRFKVGQDFVRVGAAQFSDLQYHEFYLKDYYNKEDVIAHIHKMVYHGRNTYIGRALKYIKDYFTVAQGSRKSGVPKSLVLISDGDDNDNEFDILEDEANDLRAMGVRIFAIGVGDVHLLQLLQIAGKPSRVFNVRTFKGLAEIKNEVLDRVCEPDLIPITPECSIDIAIGFDISKRTGLPGEMLVSGHHNLRKNLPQIMHYISSVSSLCCLNGTKINTSIAFQVVDSNGRSLYDTNFEEYSEDVLQKVMTLPMTQPTYFNTALLNSFQNKFATSRAGVKVLVIFSDGLDEDLNNLLHVREQLRNSEVNALLTVALEGAQNPAELQRLEFGRGFHYEERLSITMRDVGSAILKQIDSVSDRECCNVTCKCVGNDGPRGPWGPPGPKGGPGRKGQPGFAGDEGTSGARGPPGPAGPPGIQGCPGVRGQKGSRSTRGERGEKGDDGLDGLHGEQGVPGLNGSRGERGDLGNPGIPGIPGEGGLKGERGLRGDPGQPGVDNTQPGPKGEPGNPGLLGKHGPDGRKGDDGDIGNQGPDGRRGGSGRKGGPGQPAETGLPGIQGAPGLQGGRGNPGDRGPKGISGFPGPVGKHGRPGGKGQVGHRGPNGQKGQPGNPGIKGNPGSQGPRGMPGQDGRDGRGPAGPTGSKGDPGFPGYPGLQGEEGQKGTKGHPGHKGNSGRPGNTGRPGEGGGKGDKGGPGHNGRKGPPGEGISQCDLINYIRENCVCCDDTKKACPAYPTELVFGLDMTVEGTFQRQQNALLSLLKDISIAESNCPTGARVAVVGYNSVTKYLIRFQDYRRKAQLIEAVKNIRLETTTNERSLGAAMHFVGRNVFKHTRAGALMRKVAVFFTNGPSRDKNEIVTAVMEYRGLNIIPAVISLENAPNVREAMEVDDTGHSVFTLLGRPQDQAADLRKVKNCVICYDPCRHEEECSFIQEPVRPQEVGLDLVMVADSSRLMQADEYTGTQQLLSSVVEQLVVSPQPRRADGKVRIAVVQSGTWTPKLEFGLQTYQDQQRMKRHLMKDMQQQGGSSALGLTLSYTLREVFLKASQPRRRKAILTVVGTQTAYEDRARLQYISQKAKCEGVAMFVVTVGDRYDRTQVEELASLPVQQHLIHVGRLRADERGYAQRFFRVFLSALNKGMNSYPPDSVKRTCHQLQEPTPGPLAPALDLNGLGSAELMDEGTEEQEQIGVKATQLDIIETLNTEDGQSLLSVANITDARCLLRKDAGNCEKYTEKWFFDSDVGQCSHFWYSGCGGNSNRFETQKACEKLCLRKSH